jgi:hypothetical protein
MKHLFTACALAAFGVTALAQSTPMAQAPLLTSNPKLEWATKVVALQQGPDMDRLVAQLAGGTTRDMIASWQPRLQAIAVKSRLPKATEELNSELQKYSDEVSQIIRSKIQRVGTEALVPLYMERFNVDELQQLATFLDSPVIRKYQTIAPELGGIFTNKLVEASRAEVMARAKQFDDAAQRIVGPAPATPAAPTPGASTPGASTPTKPVAKPAKK